MSRPLRTIAVAAVLSAATAGCAGPLAGGPYSKARAGSAASRVEQIRAEFARARAFARLFTGLLPVDQRRRLEHLAAQVDAALAIADVAATIADRAAAAEQADQALDEFKFAAGA